MLCISGYFFLLMGQHRVMCELLGIVCCHVVGDEGGIGCAERSACSLWTEGGGGKGGVTL